MLIKFGVSNFLSFNHREEISMEASKIRKYSDRLYINRRLRLVKCEALFGSNASGKSNFIKAMQFFQNILKKGFPVGFSNKYYRLSESNKMKPSTFDIEFICNDKRFCYGFDVILNTGNITNEWLYEITPSGLIKYLFKRNIEKNLFEVGDFFKSKNAISKITIYGYDSSDDSENLFLNIINRSKGKMFEECPELLILKDIFLWFVLKLNISFPDGVLTGYPYFKDSNLEEIGNLLSAFGTGITKLNIVEVPQETVKRKIPDYIYTKVTSNLEKDNARLKRKNIDSTPSVVVRAYKEFYTFEIDINDNITIKTIEFSHESENTYFNLSEESDGTARLLDLIEIFFEISKDNIYIIDEIDRCLHPAITEKIMELFLEMAKYRNTQLIITTHETRLLKNDLFRNDEISFVSKQKEGSTIIKSLDKYKLRSDKKVYEALFDGTLESLPNFDDKKLMEIIHKK